MAERNISLERDAQGGRYVLEIEGSAPAELTYRRKTDDLIVVDHTFVPPTERGKGLAMELTERVVEDARREGLRIVPRCPYVRAKAEGNPDWADVVVL